MAGDAEVSNTLEPVVGEVTSIPNGPVSTLVLAVTGLLFLMRAARFLARVLLAYRTPAEVDLEKDGSLRVRWSVQMLGRALADRDVLVPRAALMRATREVRYPRIALYAGTLSLAIGSYLGISTCLDGARAGSASLLVMGLGIVALGLGIDFALSSLLPGMRGTCRMVFVPQRGRRICVGAVDVSKADALLAYLRRT